MTEELIVTAANAVTEIRFNRPEKKNALTRAMYDGVVAAFAAAEADPADPRHPADRHRRHVHLRQRHQRFSAARGRR